MSADPPHSEDDEVGKDVHDGATSEDETEGEDDDGEASSIDVEDDDDDDLSLDMDEDDDDDDQGFPINNGRLPQYAVEDLLDDILDADADGEYTGDDDPTTLGKLVNRFDSDAAKDKVKSGDGDQECEFSRSDCLVTSVGVANSSTSDLWLTLPDMLILLILAKIPFSALCSFRCVCKRWKELIIYPDPRLMEAVSVGNTLPLCVVRAADNRLACYNLSSHDWQLLPATFGSSFGELGFACGDQAEVYGGSDGLLVLRPKWNWPRQSSDLSFPFDPEHTFWVMNPVNKFERALTPTVKRHGKTSEHFVSVDEGQSSFKVFQVISYQKGYRNLRRIHIYNSASNSWTHTSYFDDAYKILSITEFKGCIYGLVLRVHDRGYRRPSSWILKLWKSAYGRKGWMGRLEMPPRQVDGGRFWETNGKLLLGVVYNYRSESSSNQVEDDSWIQPRRRTACTWKLIYDEVDHKCMWEEVARMPEELRNVLGTTGVPRVEAVGDFMWIISSCPVSLRTHDLKCSLGVMCHIPTNVWWILPSCSEMKLNHVTLRRTEHLNLCIPNAAFLFTPRMGLRP